MKMRLSAVLEELAKTVVRASTASPRPVRSVLRLEDLIARSPADEDPGLHSVEVYEDQGRLLRLVKPGARRGKLDLVVGVDSSSRHLEAPAADLVVATVYSAGWRGIVDYWPREPLEASGPPFILMLRNTPEASPPKGLPVATRNPAGHEYGESYSIHQALDEARVQLENWMLERLAGTLREGSVVLVDGSIFNVTVGFLKGSGPAGAAWRELVRRRVRMVKMLESRDIAVVGVVKRIERSRLLAASDRVRSLASACGVALHGEAGDRVVLNQAVTGCPTWRPGGILASPKLLVRHPPPGPERIVEYVVVPPGRYQRGPAGSRMYRLEYTERSLELLRSWGLEPVDAAALDSVARGSLEPVSIAWCDRAARRASESLRRYLAHQLLGGGASLGYSTGLEVRWSGGGEGA